MKSKLRYLAALLMGIICYTTAYTQGAQPPELLLVRSVSVNYLTNDVTIKWQQPSISNGTILKYNIYKLAATDPVRWDLAASAHGKADSIVVSGFTSVDQIPQAFTYTAVNSYGESEFADPHLVVFPHLEVDTCSFKVTVHWTRYKRLAPDMVKIDAGNIAFNQNVRYLVFGGKVGETPIQFSQHNLKDTTFVIDIPLENDKKYYFFVGSILPRETNFSYSPAAELFIKLPKIPNTFRISSIEPREKGIFLGINISSDSELSNYILKRSNDPDANYVEIHRFKDKSLTGFLDETADLRQTYYYKLEGFGPCIEGHNPAIVSNTNNNINMEIGVNDDNPTLKWSTFNPKGAQYNVKRIFPDKQTITTTSSTSYSDNIISLLQQGHDKYCYQIEGFDVDGNTTTSPPECVNITPIIVMPNAIDPTSHEINPTTQRKRNAFGPALDIDELSYSYQLEVFTRWKERIFSAKKEAGKPLSDKDFWDGTFRGKLVEPGAYMYTITVNFMNSQRQVKGSVSVIY